MLVCLYSHNCSSCDNLLAIIRFHVSYGSGTPCCSEMCNLSAVILPVITFQRYPILTTSVQTRCSALIANVWLNKIKACLRVFWGTKAICAVQGGVIDPSHSADTIGLNKKTDSRHFVPALLWLEWKVQLVWMWRCSRPQWLSLESTRFCAEHLIGSSCNRQKANEIFHNLSSCNTRSINCNLCSLW